MEDEEEEDKQLVSKVLVLSISNRNTFGKDQKVLVLSVSKQIYINRIFYQKLLPNI